MHCRPRPPLDLPTSHSPMSRPDVRAHPEDSRKPRVPLTTHRPREVGSGSVHLAQVATNGLRRDHEWRIGSPSTAKGRACAARRRALVGIVAAVMVRPGQLRTGT